MSAGPPLVSILIPAYHDRFFAEALASARAQAWPALEIVVLDDSPGEAIERIVREARTSASGYRRNPSAWASPATSRRASERRAASSSSS
jgi:cellulose synthase/poly-beta-1,6-N-acetylglucosamine synthase-like glycosyltransferase